MLKKRLVGVVTVKDGWAVQSFSYKRFLPLGKPECLVENLDRWGADEILVQVIDRSNENSGPDFELLDRLGGLGLATPLIYAGGIRSESDGVKLIQSGADRIVVDTLLHKDLSEVRGIADRLGAQAVIASLPLSWQGNSLMWLNHRTQHSSLISDDVLNLIASNVVSEVFISDWKNEGHPAGFNQKLIEEFPLHDVSIIAFGGLSECTQVRALLQFMNVSAIGVGNFLSYGELVVQKYKETLTDMPLRAATYESVCSLIADV